MKKLSKDANIVFHLDNCLVRFLFLSFILFSNLNSQTLLNNFGSSNFIKTFPGYTDFIYLDFNKDGIKDIFLYGNQEKNFVIHQGLKDSTYSTPQRKFFFYPINDFKFFNQSAKGDDYYLFVSRNKRLVGLVSFTSSNSLQLLHTIEFNSYPSSLTITDFDNDGKNEALVYGNNFNGIVKIENDGYRLNQEIVFPQSVFSDLILLDFNQDEINDVIGVDVLNNSLAYLENTEVSGFYPSREVLYDDLIYSLKRIEINDDVFPEIAIVKEKGIEVLIGDSVSSYSNSFHIATNITPDKFIISDLNLDRKPDLVIMNKFENKLSFKSDINSENLPLNYVMNGLSDFKINKKLNSSSILMLGKKGKLQRITAKHRWGKRFNFSIGGKPNKINYTKWKDSVFSYFLVHDMFDNTVNTLKMDLNGSFVEVNSTSFLNSFTDFNYSKSLTQLIGYSKENRLIEIINLKNDSTNTLRQNYTYTTNPILQLIVEDENNYKILEKSSRNLFLESIKKFENNYVQDNIIFIDSLVLNAKMNSQNQIVYWKRNERGISFIKSRNNEVKNLISINYKDNFPTQSLILNDLSQKNENLITVFNDTQTEKIYLIKNDNVELYKSNIRILGDSLATDQNIKFYSIGLKDKYIFAYKPLHKRLLVLKLDEKKKFLQLSNSVEAVEINDYFVNQFFNKTYLVYTDNDNNCITYKILN
ncbi:MAG: hypothetical protein H6610_06635 [Ignavibacteriales bacterium]|nr:hypothetical protein [Ignavibacteriales bacterium]